MPQGPNPIGRERAEHSRPARHVQRQLSRSALLLAALASVACDLGEADLDAAHGPALRVLASQPTDLRGIGCDLNEPGCGFPVNQAVSFAFDRPILPFTAIRQSLAISAGAYGSPFLQPSYDLFTRSVTFNLSGAFERNLLYRLTLPVAEERGQAGFRAYDGAPLDASSAPTSYLVYKLLVHDRSMEPCRGPSCPFEDLPGARSCKALDAEEIERMKDWFVMGEAMPLVREAEQAQGCAPPDTRPLDCGSMRAIERWIENGALCP